jgi:peptide/nickel transport system substrate-binding protein
MNKSLVRLLVVALAAAFALVFAVACGDDDDDDGGGQAGAAEITPVDGQKKGGTLNVISSEAFEHLDPGQTYFQLDYTAIYAVHKTLYSYRPDNFQKPEPDLAASDPQVSDDLKTVTVKIKPNVRYSGHVNRPVSSKDVKYAIERAFSPQVASGYAATYFSTIVGADKAKGGPIQGIETPDDQTIVFKLSTPDGANLSKALVMPITAPVPEEYAGPMDRKTPTGYESDPVKQAFTGPYMIESYEPSKKIVLVRNPNWSADTDFKPAYVDRVEWTLGADANVAGRQIFTGSHLINGDTPTASAVKEGVTKRKEQISFTPLGNRYVSLNTTIKPFNDINVRKAVSAIMDRRAMQLTRGGAVAGEIATHLLPPTIPGYEEAGGKEGPGFDFLAKPEGDPELAAEYMKKAGFANGKYSGPPILMIADTQDPANKTGQVVLQSVQKLGFKVNYRAVSHEAFYSKFCNVRKQLEQIAVCANYGWLPDFNDPLTMLDPTFNGKNIVPVNNVNPSLLNDPKINAQLDKAKQIVDEKERAAAFGEADRMITESAASVPWFWDNTPNIQSEDVQGVIAQWNAAYDLSWTSLK